MAMLLQHEMKCLKVYLMWVWSYRPSSLIFQQVTVVEWREVSVSALRDFSAACWFFGVDLYKALNPDGQGPILVTTVHLQGKSK